jgi:hypothetical protein
MQNSTMFWRTPSKTRGLFRILPRARIRTTRSFLFPEGSHKWASWGDPKEEVKQGQVRGLRWAGDHTPHLHPLAIQRSRNAASGRIVTARIKWAGAPSSWNHMRGLPLLPVAVLMPISLWRRRLWPLVLYPQFLPLTPPQPLKICKNYSVTPCIILRRWPSKWLIQQFYNYWNKSPPKADWKN